MPEDPESRRDFLGGIFTSAGKVVSRRVGQITQESSLPATADSYHSLLRPPDSIRILSNGAWISLEQLRGGVWSCDVALVRTQLRTEAISLSLEATDAPVEAVVVRWRADIKGVRRYLAFGQGRQEWRSESPDRPMRGRFATHDGKRTHNYGVRPQSGAIADWLADRHGMTLWLDVRSGSGGVNLVDRELNLCTITCREGNPDESAFQAIRSFNTHLCPHPRLAAQRLFGLVCRAGDIWDNAKIVAELAPDGPNRPFLIVPSTLLHDVPAFVGQAKDLSLRPGIAHSGLQDLAQVEQLAGAGVEMFDFALPTSLAPDSSRTQAEQMVALLTAIRGVAGRAYLSVAGGDELQAAGLVERVGRGGGLLDQVNSIAFSGAANGVLSGMDPGPIMVDQNLHHGPSSQLVDLASKSGCPFFIELDPIGLGVGDWTLIRDALEAAAVEHEQAEPLDWTSSTVPSKWRFLGNRTSYDWLDAECFLPVV